MILGPYVRRWGSVALAMVFTIVGLLTFEYEDYFNRASLCVYFLLLLFSIDKKDINFSGILGILIFELLATELIAFIYDYEGVKLVIYLLTPIVLFKLRYDTQVKYLCVPVIVFILLTEFYWLITDYPAPALHFIVAVLLVSLIAKHLFFLRVPLTKAYLKQESKPLPIDWSLYGLEKVTVCVVLAMLAEYLLRHITPSQSLVIYELYTPAIHLITVATAFFVLDHILSSKFTIKA
jgi:hypothetical protein